MKKDLISLFCLLSVASSAQPYSIDWRKIAGGGGAGNGGSYQVKGTIGQHDASASLSGGNYALTGGFWSLYALQTPGAPNLGIKATATNTIMVYWPSASTGFNLQMNTDLGSGNWITPSEPVNDDGSIKYIIVNPPTGNRFYRLKSP